MMYPIFETRTKAFQYTVLWAVYAIAQTFAFFWLLKLPFSIVLVDGFIHAVVYGTLAILLWSVLKYGNFSALSAYQRIVNHIAMALLTIGLWQGIAFGLFYILLGSNYATQLLVVFPIRFFIGILIYLLISISFKLKSINGEISNEITDKESLIEGEKTKQIDIIERIAVKSGSKIHVILVPEILYLQADGDYVHIFTSNGKYLKEQTMKYFEEHLPSGTFVRVHRSTIVNVEMISRVELYEKQSQLLTLKNGNSIKTSPAGYKALRVVLNL